MTDTDGTPVAGAEVRYADPMRSAMFRRGDPVAMVSQHYGTKTDAEGRYQLLVPAGDALVVVHAGKEYATTTMPQGKVMGYFGMGALNAKHQFEAKSGGTAEANMQLQAASKSPIVVVDPDGKPLTGCRMVGLAPGQIWYEDGKKKHDTHEFELLAFDPKRRRNVAAYHEERRLIGMLTNEALTKEQPWVLQLQPEARITGQLVDVDGVPRAGVAIYVTSDLPPDPGSMGFISGQMEQLAGTKETDAEGRFELIGLMPGATFTVRTLDEAIADRRVLAKDVKVEAGEVKDLGKVAGDRF